MGMLLYGLNDGELRAACFRAFNDYAAEYCSYNPKRLVGLLGTVELEDIPAGVKELELGVRLFATCLPTITCLRCEIQLRASD